MFPFVSRSDVHFGFANPLPLFPDTPYLLTPVKQGLYNNIFNTGSKTIWSIPGNIYH